jgi:hypothetical protein
MVTENFVDSELHHTIAFYSFILLYLYLNNIEGAYEIALLPVCVLYLPLIFEAY